MTDTNMQSLTQKELAVLRSVVVQRRGSYGDVFEYDYTRGQQYLACNSTSRKYVIDIARHHEIMKKLSDNHVISLDYLRKIDPPDPRSIFNSNIPYVEFELNMQRASYMGTKPIIFWANSTEWACDYFQKSGQRSIEEVYTEIGSAHYVKMTNEDIKDIEERYEAKYEVVLRLCEDPPCLAIAIDREKIVRFRRMYDEQLPFQVLKHAYDNPNELIARNDLRRAGIKIGKKSIKSQIFGTNPTVLALDPMFLTLNSDSIMFKTEPVHISLAKLKELKNTLRISQIPVFDSSSIFLF